MKAVLINPNYTFWKQEKQYLSRVLGAQPPLGLLSLASFAQEQVLDLKIEIIDARLYGWSLDRTLEAVVPSAPDLVGITLTTVVSDDAEHLARRLKAALPKTRIAAGGPHVSGMKETFLRRSPSFDLAFYGEGERAFKEVLLSRLDPAGIPGVMHRGPGGELLGDRAPSPIEDLDRLPPLDWSLLRGFPHAYEANAFFSPGLPTASLTTSRGCPYTCRFCDHATFGYKYRALSAEGVVRAVLDLREKYGICYFLFCDDTFTIDRDRVLEICRRISHLKRPIKWSCDANLSTVDSEMLQAMKQAGCWSISYGLESGSPRVLESLGKKIDLNRAREVVAETRKAGIHAKGLFMIGTPEESWETIEQTGRFIDGLPLSTANFSKFAPYPGIALSSLVPRCGEIAFHRLNGMNFVVPSRHLSIEELEEAYDRVVKRFYHRPGAWKAHIVSMLGRWRNLRRFMALAFTPFSRS